MIIYSNQIFNFKEGSVLFQYRGSVIQNAFVATIPSALLAVFCIWWVQTSELGDWGEEFKKDFASDTLKSSQLWGAMFGSVTFLVGFRTNKAYARFWDGTTLLNQMWGEWFDAASCLFAFSHLAKEKKPDEVKAFRHTLIRLMSLMHGSALEEIAQSDAGEEGYPCIDMGGLDMTSLGWLNDCKFDKELSFNRVEVIIHMIQILIVEAQDKGVLKIPPPILSRVFQTISRGQVNLANCKKITLTLFPFPFAQMIQLLLILVSILTPLVMSSLIQHWQWALIFTVFPLFGLNALHFVAKELELPFGNDPNDLPLDDFHLHMNTSMLMLIRKESDIVPHMGQFAETDFHKLKTFSKARPEDFIKENELKKSTSFASPAPELKHLQAEAKQPKDSILEKSLEVPPQAVIPSAEAKVSEAAIVISTTGEAHVVPPLLTPFCRHDDYHGTHLPQPQPRSNTAAATVEPADMVLDIVMQSKLEQLSKALEGLMSNTKDLSTQIGQNSSAFQDLKIHTGAFSQQLVQSSQVMAEFTKDKPPGQKTMAGSTWSKLCSSDTVKAGGSDFLPPQYSVRPNSL